MPDLDLEELKRLVAEATPGQWAPGAYEIWAATWETIHEQEFVAKFRRREDMKLAAAAKEALPELIARVERAEKALAFIRDENWAWATRETPSEAPRRVYGRWSEVARTVVPEPALTGDTPNV